MPLPILAPTHDLYVAKIATLDEYILESIDLLQLSEINLRWLADCMGVSKRTLEDRVRHLRSKGLIDIPTVDPRIPR